MYNLDQQYTEYPKIAAEIISKDPGNWYDTFMINRGSADGIRVDNNVLADKGLVGIVTEVGTHWATVRSIIDDSSNVSAMTVSTQDNCVVEGDLELIDEGKLSFSQLYDQNNKVTVGQLSAAEPSILIIQRVQAVDMHRISSAQQQLRTYCHPPQTLQCHIQ